MPDLGQLCFAITLLIAYLYSNNGISREVTNGILTIFSMILTILQSIVGHEPQKSSHSLSTIRVWDRFQILIKCIVVDSVQEQLDGNACHGLIEWVLPVPMPIKSERVQFVTL